MVGISEIAADSPNWEAGSNTASGISRRQNTRRQARYIVRRPESKKAKRHDAKLSAGRKSSDQQPRRKKKGCGRWFDGNPNLPKRSTPKASLADSGQMSENLGG